ncbi:MAG: hypothetical protein IH623_07910 [Verrucomicrobia bacterium]|nr:hypothetical protein [Verrucomicrobiota bacterium]
MSDSMLVNHQHPTRTSALEPIRRWFDDTSGIEVITNPMIVLVHVKSGDGHACPKLDHGSGLI